MESDDDYETSSPVDEPSPPVQHRKLRRLKKSIKVSNDQPADEGLSVPPVISFDSQALGSSDSPSLEELSEPLKSHESPSEGFDVDNDLNFGNGGLHFGGASKETKRDLDFDDMNDEMDGKISDQRAGMEEIMGDLNMDISEKKRLIEDDSCGNKGKRKKKRVENDEDTVKPKTSSTKRRDEEERKTYLQQLHVESQKLLRETRDATFKPIPVVHKPISSVLEKIRKRKLELLKKTVIHSNSSFAEDFGISREGQVDHDSENVPTEEREVSVFAEVMQNENKRSVCHLDVDSDLGASDVNGSKEAATILSHENNPSIMALDEQSRSAFRAPLDDTQDLFGDSQSSEGKDEMSNEQANSPLEEVLAPSILAMNLKFDSAPSDDIEEKDNDKENFDPYPDRADNGCFSPRGDPVKAFVDDEAVEEDDSDNDLLRFPENEEDEGNEDYEELNDLIATQYEEKPSDNERRNELHQKWLEQQDAVGTENLLQRLKYGSKLKDSSEFEREEEDDDDEDEGEFCDITAEDSVKNSIVRINSRNAKQMLPQMFSDANDGYLSSDEEETEKRLVKQRLLDKAEEEYTLVPLVEDESSREVFGLIKKLSIVPDAKKKLKTTSFFDKMLTRGNNNSSSKSSFLGRAPSHPLPSSHKKGTSTSRSFIFGRDDSNSRSSISVSEDSSDAIPVENPPARIVTSKFSSSQPKFSTQNTKTAAAAEAVTGSDSIFEILKRSSMQSNVCIRDTTVGLSQSMFAAFKIPKKPVKIERRI